MAAFALPLALMGISGLSGLLGNRKKTNTQTQTSTSNQSGTDSYDNSSNPILTPEAQHALDLLMPMLQNRFSQDPDLRGYKAEGLRNIGQEGVGARAKLAQMIASRGLGNSPAAAGLYARQGDQEATQAASFQSSIPLMARQFMGEDLDRLAKVTSMLPTGMRNTGTRNFSSTGTTNSSGTMTDPGNPWGGLVSGLGQGLASTYGYNWALDQQKKRGMLGGYQNPRSNSGMGDV